MEWQGEMRIFVERLTIMTEREQLAKEIEGLGDGLIHGGYTITDPDEVSLRSQCLDTIIRNHLHSYDITETIRRADILYRYISKGEIPGKDNEEEK